MSTEIFVTRHADAIISTNDPERKLSEYGILQAKMNNNYLKNMCPNFQKFDKVFVSPYLRAQMTCDLMLEDIKVNERETDSLLTPNGNYLNFIAYLENVLSQSDFKTILIVSHLPFVDYLVEDLTGKNILFETGTIARLSQISDSKYKLLSTYSPKP
jgi:phosphohistidine phosphatase